MTDDRTHPSFTDKEYAFLRHVRFGELPRVARPEERVELTETEPRRAARSRSTSRSAGTCGTPETRRRAAGVAAHGPSGGTGQKTGTPSRTSRQFGWKKSPGSIVPRACAQSMSSWRISCCAL